MTIELTQEQIEQIKQDLINQYGPKDMLPIGEIIGFLIEKYKV